MSKKDKKQKKKGRQKKSKKLVDAEAFSSRYQDNACAISFPTIREHTRNEYYGNGISWTYEIIKGKVLFEDHIIEGRKITTCIDITNPTIERFWNTWHALNYGKIFLERPNKESFHRKRIFLKKKSKEGGALTDEGHDVCHLAMRMNQTWKALPWK